jgi:hypothetical protein
MKPARIAPISAERDEWLRRATAAAIAAAKDVVGATGPIRPSMPIGKLTVSEWGWIVSSAIWAWVATRAQQAATEGWDLEQTIRTLSSGSDINPWDTGSVMAILPRLPEACGDGFDWAKPIGDWSKETISEFLLVAFRLALRATIARDVLEAQVANRPVGADVIAHEVNAVHVIAAEMASASNLDTTPGEFTVSDSDCPF